MRWWRGAIPAGGARRPAQDGGGPRTGRRAVRGWPTVTGPRSSLRRARWRAAGRRRDGQIAATAGAFPSSVSSNPGRISPRPLDEQRDRGTVAELLEMSVGMRELRAPERATRLRRRCRALLGSSQAGAATDNDGAGHASPAAHASRRCSHASSTMSPGRWPMRNVAPSRGSELDVTPSAGGDLERNNSGVSDVAELDQPNGAVLRLGVGDGERQPCLARRLLAR